jgi:hypothetical protein
LDRIPNPTFPRKIPYFSSNIPQHLTSSCWTAPPKPQRFNHRRLPPVLGSLPPFVQGLGMIWALWWIVSGHLICISRKK